jgi:hypothetical protein
MKTTTLLLLLSAGLALAQAPAVPPAPVTTTTTTTVTTSTGSTTYPGYGVFTGGGYVRNSGLPNTGEGWISGEFGLGGGNYLVTTLDLTSVNTIRFGYERILNVTGNTTLGARVDSGIQAVTPVIGSFSGGGFLRYDLKGVSQRLAGIKIHLEARVIGATGVAAQTITTTTSTGGQTTTTTVSTGTPGATSQVNVGFYLGIGKTF